MDFAFDAGAGNLAVSQPSEKGTSVAAPGSATPSARSSVSGQCLDESTCIACSEKRYLRFRVCRTHKNVTDSMARDAKAKDTAATKQTGVQTTASYDAHTETMKDDVLAALKICKFEADNPAAQRGRKRGSFDHCEFNHQYSTRQINRNFKQVKMMDEVEFCTLKETTRRWTVTKSLAEWEKLKSDLSVRRDNKGEDSECPLRLEVVIGEFTNEEDVTEESKNYSIHAKRMKSMAPADLKQVLQELRMGMRSFKDPFHSQSAASSSGAFTQPLASNAMLGFAVPESVGGAGKQGHGDTLSQVATSDAVFSDLGDSPSQSVAGTMPKDKEKEVDLQSLRTNAYAKQMREAQKELTTLISVAASAVATLRRGDVESGDDPFTSIIQERLNIVLEVLALQLKGGNSVSEPREGARPDVEMEPESALSFTTVPDIFEPKYFKIKGSTSVWAIDENQKRLDEKLNKLVLLPVQKKANLVTHTRVLKETMSLHSLTSLDAVKAVKSAWADNQVAWRQLSKSLAKSIADLTNNITKREESKKAEQTKAEKARKEAEQKLAKDAARRKLELSNRLVGSAEDCKLFSLDLGTTHGKLIPVIDGDNDESLSDTIAENTLEKPFVLVNSKVVQTEIIDNSDTQAVLSAFAQKFKATHQYADKADGRVFAPVSVKCALTSMTSIAARLVSEEHSLGDASDRKDLQRLMKSAWHWGARKGKVYVSPEPFAQASIRLNCGDDMLFACIDIANVDRRPDMDTITAFFLDMSAETLEQVQGLWHGVVPKDGLVYVPPGCLCIYSGGQNDLHGLRLSVIPSSFTVDALSTLCSPWLSIFEASPRVREAESLKALLSAL